LEQHNEDGSRIQFDNPRFFPDLLGHQDEHLRVIERALRVKIAAANNTLVITGDETQRLLAGRVATQLYGLLQNGYPIYPSDVDYAIRILSRDRSANLKDIFLDTVYISAHRRTITPKSIAQKMYIDAIRRFDIVFGIGPAGTGKCIASSSLVLTSQGLLPIATLASGTTTGNYTPVDFSVSGIDGTERASHFYDGGVSPTRRITTRLGFEIEVTPEHPLLQLQPDGTTAWRRAETLQLGDFVAIQRGQAMFGQDTAIQFTYQPNGHRDHAKPIAVDTLDEDLGYLLGLLTGDGCLTFLNRVILSSADEEILAFFSRMAERFGLHVFKNGADRPYDRIIASAQLYQLLLHLGMTNGRAATKRVPLAVLRAPRAIVVAYLQGLFDTDGTVDRRSGYPVFCSVSKELVDQVQVLLLNFGILSSKRVKWSIYQGERRRSYLLEIAGAEADRFYSEIGFRLPRKQRLRRPCAQLVEVHANHVFGAEITAIEEGEAHVYDLTVPGTHSFCANGFVNHNTYLAMAMAVAELMKHKVSRVVLTRPAVEAGEKLGFLPGDLAEKINPYLRPLYDALYDMVDYDRASKMIERGTIEVAPLAFMRGRAQPLASRVLTPTGWREIGSLGVGDDVIGSDGRPTTVLGVYPQGKKEVFQVTVTDGASTLCCAEHLWAVSTPADRRRGKGNRVLETRAMMGQLQSAHQHRYELPLLSEPVQFPARDVPLDPYALGLLLGDGCLTGKTTPTFSSADQEMVATLEASLDNIELVYKSGVDYVLRHTQGGRGGVIVANPVTEKLRALGLCGTRSHTKFVPPAYLYNSPAVRLAVLQGLLDTDGGPVTQKGRSCRVQFSTSSPQLRDDVIFLVRSLGGVTYGRTRRQEDKKPGCARGRAVFHRSDSYVLDIRLPKGMAPFRLARKAELYSQYGGGRPMRFLKAITPAGAEETMCIRVAAPDQLYVTEDFILTHNTLNDSFVILDEAQNTTSEQMKMFLTRLGYGSKAVITGDVTQVDLPTGTRSGLKEAQRILRGIEGINFSFFSEKDVVRHRLVQDVIMAYERAHDEQERFEEERREQRRLRTQERVDHRHFGHGSRSEPERPARMDSHDSAPSGPDTGRTQPGASDGPDDPRAEPPVSREGQTD
jgi:phosphate starvation-inducible protein PhoH and related proteins